MIDPWLEHQLRLAERRGLLGSGRPLSVVQQAGLEVLMLLDAREAKEAKDVAMKLAIVSADPQQYLPVMFPPTGTERVDAEAISQEQIMDTTGGEWVMDEGVDPREAERLIEQMLANRSGEFGVDALEG